jgi:hypothetical protein
MKDNIMILLITNIFNDGITQLFKEIFFHYNN